MMVGALASHKIFLVNLADTMRTGKLEPCQTVSSPLKYQTRHVEAFPNGNGYVVTSIEGRCGVKNIDFNNLTDQKHAKDFNFKCHRKESTVFAVHDAAFNFKYDTFMTAGGDGGYYCWDKENRKRLKNRDGCDWPITACAMASNASMCAYAFGYDWARGCQESGKASTAIYLSPLIEKDVKGG